MRLDTLGLMLALLAVAAQGKSFSEARRHVQAQTPRYSSTFHTIFMRFVACTGVDEALG